MSKEHAYAYEAGYRDGSINYELDHCPACKNVADLQEALDENAKLRACLGDGCADCAISMGRYADSLCDPLKTENAKLRELVVDLHMAYIGALNECEGRDEGLIWEYSYDVDTELAKSHAKFEADRHRFDVAMQELGIEARTFERR